MLLVLNVIFASFVAHAEGADLYKRLSPDCASCAEIDALMTKHSSTPSPTDQLNITLEIAKAIGKISIKDQPEVEQRRAIYFAIKATVDALDEDFDSQTVAYLMRVRPQAPKQFDYVFWRFPLERQKEIVERMRALIANELVKKVPVPTAKQLE
jgi:hypothetical protein